MGMLVEGHWTTENAGVVDTRGNFVRRDGQFRNWITSDGSSPFQAEAGRYHLYVSAACPWAHRTLIFRSLKKLNDIVSLSIVDPFMTDEGWYFSNGAGCVPDTVNGCDLLRDVYLKADPATTTRVTVPVLWDKQRQTIVSNESSEIIRMFGTAFDTDGAAPGDYYPGALQDDIDRTNDTVYAKVNNGVYRCGFARSQEAYEMAFDYLFAALDSLESDLAIRRYLVGGRTTEADWRLFPTLVRFDAVYHTHFKCNRNRIVDFPNLSGYLRDLYQTAGVAETFNMDHIKGTISAATRVLTQPASCHAVQTSISPSHTIVVASTRPRRAASGIRTD